MHYGLESHSSHARTGFGFDVNPCYLRLSKGRFHFGNGAVARGDLFTLTYFSIIKLVYSCHHRNLGILKCLLLCGTMAPLETMVF